MQKQKLKKFENDVVKALYNMEYLPKASHKRLIEKMEHVDWIFYGMKGRLDEYHDYLEDNIKEGKLSKQQIEKHNKNLIGG